MSDSPGTAWRDAVLSLHMIDEGQAPTLRLAAEALDRAALAQDAIDTHGVIVEGLHGPKQNPAVPIKRDAVQEHLRLCRVLGIFSEEIDHDS